VAKATHLARIQELDREADGGVALLKVGGLFDITWRAK
jgi:hypothetical protein